MTLVSPPIRLPNETIEIFSKPMICISPAENVEVWEIQAIMRILFSTNPIHPVHEPFSFENLVDAVRDQETLPRGFYLVNGTNVPVYDGTLTWCNRLVNEGSSVFVVTQPRCLKRLVTGDLLYPKDVGVMIFSRMSTRMIRVTLFMDIERTWDFLFDKVDLLTALKQEDRDLCENNEIEDSTYQALQDGRNPDSRLRLVSVAEIPCWLFKPGTKYTQEKLPL